MSAAPRRRGALLALRLHFDRDRLPDPERYYASELGALHGGGEWRSARCPFHEDTRPSLRVSMETGSYRCFACGAAGGDLLDFHQARHGLGFKDAALALGAWTTGGRHA
jgi:hypothetical protein